MHAVTEEGYDLNCYKQFRFQLFCCEEIVGFSLSISITSSIKKDVGKLTFG